MREGINTTTVGSARRREVHAVYARECVVAICAVTFVVLCRLSKSSCTAPITEHSRAECFEGGTSLYA